MTFRLANSSRIASAPGPAKASGVGLAIALSTRLPTSADSRTRLANVHAPGH